MLPTLTWVQLYLYPLLTTLLLWGMLTLGLLWLNRRPPAHSRLVLVVMLGVLALAHHQLWLVRNDPGYWGSYRAFIASMVIWAWHELAFYSGVLTGPWRTACPRGVRGLHRLGYALATHLYHIAAVGIDVLVLWWLHQDATNAIGFWSFCLFWSLQLSAKLNVLLGVRNLQPDLFPHHLRYLASFWNERPANPFFWPSVIAGSVVAVLLWIQAAQQAPDGSAVGMSLLAGLTTLGVLEHFLLVLPLNSRSEVVAGSEPADSGH
jgi:putative photosynthetic complex assembly protein 2